MTKTLQDLQKEVQAWTKQTFSNDTLKGKLAHLRTEVEELAAKPGDRSEQADVLILLVGVAGMVGISGDQLLEAAFAKMEINRRRQWTKTPDANGIYKHV